MIERAIADKEGVDIKARVKDPNYVRRQCWFCERPVVIGPNQDRIMAQHPGVKWTICCSLCMVLELKANGITEIEGNPDVKVGAAEDLIKGE